MSANVQNPFPGNWNAVELTWADFHPDVCAVQDPAQPILSVVPYPGGGPSNYESVKGWLFAAPVGTGGSIGYSVVQAHFMTHESIAPTAPAPNTDNQYEFYAGFMFMSPYVDANAFNVSWDLGLYCINSAPGPYNTHGYTWVTYYDTPGPLRDTPTFRGYSPFQQVHWFSTGFPNSVSLQVRRVRPSVNEFTGDLMLLGVTVLYRVRS